MRLKIPRIKLLPVSALRSCIRVFDPRPTKRYLEPVPRALIFDEPEKRNFPEPTKSLVLGSIGSISGVWTVRRLFFQKSTDTSSVVLSVRPILSAFSGRLRSFFALIFFDPFQPRQHPQVVRKHTPSHR